MHVLHVIPSFAPAWEYGGPIQAAYGLTRALARFGHQVTVATTNISVSGTLDVPVATPVKLDNIEVWYFPIEHSRRYCYSRSLAKNLRESMHSFDIAHIHSIFLWPTTIAAYWARKTGVPYIIRPAGMLDPTCWSKKYAGTVGSIAARAKKEVYLATIGQRELSSAAAFHFTSEAELNVSILPKTNAERFVIPHGVEPMSSHPDSVSLRDKYPQLRGKKIVLFFSRLDPKKGLEVLAAALGQLAKSRTDFSFVVAGEGSTDYVTQFKETLRREGIFGLTVFTGFLQGQAKWDALREADLFVLPSYQENFGIAVIEAMAAGTAVIVSDGVNTHQEVSAGNAGLVVRVDAAEIKAALDKVLSDEAMRRSMGEAGEAIARKKFGWDNVAARLSAKYEQLAARGSKRTLTTVGAV